MSVSDIQIGDVKAFHQVACSGSFTRAAKTLGCSTKQVSRQVQRLEAATGKRLLHRTTHAVSMTEPGRAFFLRATRLLDEVHAAVDEMHHDANTLRGELRVVVPTLDVGVTNWVRTMREEHPLVRVQISVTDHPVDLVADSVDVQIVVQRPTQTTFLIRKLHTLHSRLAAHASYFSTTHDKDGANDEVRAKPETPVDLVDHECLLWISNEVQQSWTLVNDDSTSVSVEVAGSVRSDSSAILFSALREGIGIGPCGASYLDDVGREQGLVEVLPGWSFEPLAVYAVYPEVHRRSRLVQDFLARAAVGLKRWY